MTEPPALQKLLTWLSPAFPVGAFAWSTGLETAIASSKVADAAALQDWIEGTLAHGGIRTDAIVLAHAWRIACGRPLHHASHGPPPPLRGGGSTAADTAVGTSSPVHGGGGPPKAVEGAATSAELRDLADLSLALTPAAERHAETTLTGDAFIRAAAAWPSEIYAKLPDPCPYPIAVGTIAAAHRIGLADTLLGYLTAAVHSQVSVAVRLVPLGQTDGLKVMAALEPRIAALATAAATATLDDLGGIAYAADIAQMRHETLEPRIFRS